MHHPAGARDTTVICTHCAGAIIPAEVHFSYTRLLLFIVGVSPPLSPLSVIQC